MAKQISIPQKELVDEHKHLVRVLLKGTLAQRKTEAYKQARELKDYIKGKK